VGQHQHLALRQLRQPRKDDGLAGAGRQADQQASHAAPTRGQHRLDGFGLIRSQGHFATSIVGA
jgi:hypothetical protein